MWLTLTGRNVKNGKYARELVQLGHDRFNYNITRKHLLRKAHDIVKAHERSLARGTEGYDEAYEEQQSKQLASRNALIAELDKEGVTNDKIRKAYINTHTKSYYEITDNYVSSFENNALQHVHNMVNVLIDFEEPEEED